MGDRGWHAVGTLLAMTPLICVYAVGAIGTVGLMVGACAVALARCFG